MKPNYLKNLPIQRKMTLLSLASTVMALLLFLTLTIAFQVRMLQKGMVNHLEVLAGTISRLGPESVDLRTWDRATHVLAALEVDEDIESATVYDLDYNVVAAYGPFPDLLETEPPEWRQENGYRFVRQENVYKLVFFHPIISDGRRIGNILLVATMLRVQQQVYVTALLMVAGAAIFLLVTHLAARRLQRTITEPVSRLAATARRIAELGDYSVRVDRAGKDEIGGLVDHFNTMLDAIQVRDSELHQHRHNLELIVEERTEELRRRRDEALAASQAKTEFLANMSHEIRTPMNGVIGVLSLLKDAPLTEGYRRLLEIAGRSADSLMHIINDILDFSKIDAGMVEFESIPFDICELVEEVTSLYVDAACSRAIDLFCHVPPDIHCSVEGDPTRLRQVLTNLVSNAVKFTKAGRVFVRVERIEAQHDKQLLRFAISDTGIGVPDKLMPRLFEKFTQADGSITRHFGGTGLGLSVCKQLVELQGGDIGVYSREGEGAEFWFTLQFRMVRAAEEQHGSSFLKGVRALIVDGNKINRMIVESYLAAVGLVVSSCSAAQDALLQLQDAATEGRSFDLVLIDPLLLAGNGPSLATRIRSLAIDKIPRLFVFSSGGIEQADRAGVHGIVYKPVRRGQLIDTLVGTGTFDQLGKISGRQGPAEWPKLSGKILLVDDEPINRNVACAILERFGLETHTASHGREAVQRAETDEYDIILMDIQMPEMSGYEATELIRARERAGTKRRVSIIAMTANALKSTKLRCLQAGMDDFISKPIKPEMLAVRLRPWLGAGFGGAAEGLSDLREQPMAEHGMVWNRQQALQLIGGDDALLADLIRLFLTRKDMLLNQVGQAIQVGDPALLDDAAHALKGAVNHFCAERVVHYALRLEMKGKAADLNDAADIFQRLEFESGRLVEQLSREVVSVDVGGV